MSSVLEVNTELQVAQFIIRILSISIIAIGSGCLTSRPVIDVRLESNLAYGEVRLPASPENEPVYVFSFDRRLEPREDIRIYTALLEYLEYKTNYHFRLHVTPRTGSLVSEILSGEVDFAAVGVLTYLQVRESSDAEMLVRGINKEGESTYQAFIVTRPESGLFSLDDLRGHTFAFGARNSTQGYLIPRIMLSQANIDLSDLNAYEFTKSHFETSNAVISGRADAGALQDTLANVLAEQGLIRIIARSDYYPSSGIMAGDHVPTEVIDAVREALVAFDPNHLNGVDLYHWERTEMPNGFRLTSDSAYNTLRTWAETFHLLGQ